MNRTFRLLVLLLGAVAVAGCTAGTPGATADPSPTAEPTIPPAEPTPDIDTAPGFQTNSEPATGPQADRLPPPPDPGTGQSLIMPDPNTLESPLFGDDPNELQVALTFDAGADRGYAAEILDTLAAEGIKASFGMTGEWAEANPDLVQRMVDEGHMLFNHTWDHDSLTGANTDGVPQTAEQVAQQLIDTETVVRELTGYEMRPYFRPPYGDYSEEALAYLADNGYYITVWWTCDSFGWKGWTADQINDYCTQNLKNHEIILLHVGIGAAGDYESLPGMIASFREQGYEFVTVEEMVQP
ncbi:MAG: polysaccharide deacetylase family protein [Chloroflexota bacterium]|nr:polysaccharide deacetylase family protein [Chloroflexota bacterium]